MGSNPTVTATEKGAHIARINGDVGAFCLCAFPSGGYRHGTALLRVAGHAVIVRVHPRAASLAAFRQGTAPAAFAAVQWAHYTEGPARQPPDRRRLCGRGLLLLLGILIRRHPDRFVGYLVAGCPAGCGLLAGRGTCFGLRIGFGSPGGHGIRIPLRRPDKCSGLVGGPKSVRRRIPERCPSSVSQGGEQDSPGGRPGLRTGGGRIRWRWTPAGPQQGATDRDRRP